MLMALKKKKKMENNKKKDLSVLFLSYLLH